MYKHIICVSLADLNFQRIFSQSLAAVSRNLDIRTAADFENGLKNSEEFPAFHILLFDYKTEKEIKERRSSLSDSENCILIRLTYDPDSASGEEGENVFYAYEGARETAGRIANLISEKWGEEIELNEDEGPAIISFFSRGGGSGTTVISEAVCHMIGLMYGEKSLHASYGAFGRDEDEWSGDFARLLYFIHRKKDFHITPFIEDKPGWGRLKTGVFNPRYTSLTDDIIAVAAAKAGTEWGASYVIVDIGNRLDERAMEILKRSEIIVEISDTGDDRFVFDGFAGKYGITDKKYIKVANRWKGEWSSEKESVVYISGYDKLDRGNLDTEFGTETGAIARLVAEDR